MTIFQRFLFWLWAKLFLGRLNSQILERAIKLSKMHNLDAGELGYDPRTKHLISYAKVRKDLGNPETLTGAIIHIAVAVSPACSNGDSRHSGSSDAGAWVRAAEAPDRPPNGSLSPSTIGSIPRDRITEAS